jgi:hypothetical protein
MRRLHLIPPLKIQALKLAARRLVLLDPRRV